MNYGIIGTGAIGGYYGARLAQSGQEVHFLLHRDYDYVCEHGLQIDSCNGSFHLNKPNVYRQTSDMPPCDVVLVCLKTTNNHLLPTLLPPLLHERTLVVLIQNGVGVEADVQQLFPGVQLAAGLAFICSAKTEPGRVSHQCYGQINLANYSCRDDGLMQLVAAHFNAAGVKAGLVEYNEARWKKTVWNMPFNGMTVALNTRTDLLLGHPATRQLIREQMMEVVGAARSLGVENIGEDFVELMLQMTDEMTPYSPSMKLDFDFHRPMEIHYLYELPIELARQAGFAMPRLQMLMQELTFLDSGGRK
ncbi:MAG: putative 2-dehydropantoate 2-reductase [Prevotella sp.]|nr:putative 2-dehydropantoate 2-reductase [Prevotella sp.]